MNLTARVALLLIFFLVASFGSLIFLIIAYKISPYKQIDIAFVNGFITASGIFLGAISAASISKSEELDVSDYFMIRTSFVLFFLAILIILSFEIMSSELYVWHLVFLGGSLVFDVFTAWLILESLFRKTRH